VQLRLTRAFFPPEQTTLDTSCGKRVTGEGVLLIEAKRFRTQEQNREDAVQRFVELIRKALVKPKARKKTKPTRASKEVRIKEKKRRGEIKKMRQSRSVERD
jgi:ribosome-associated protein